MHYIIVTELESPEESTCHIKGLPMIDVHNLLLKLVNNNIPCNNLSKLFEADASGAQLLNILCGSDFNYSVVSQSMAIETTAIGGRTVKVQKLVWTMVNKKN